ncbi:MAG TPA: hypothetical protein PLP33_25970 [Leptospiraceae bacterium]|nr:hypothetical protein [Leptospiraceae bacterium]
MALIENNNNASTKYLKIADFSICEKYSTEQPGWAVLKTKDSTGKEYTSWIKRYRGVEGIITGIEFVTRILPGTNGTKVSSWKITLSDNGEKYSLDIPSTSPAASRFVKLAENIDPTQPVEISAWKDTSEAKPKLAFMVKQNGANIPQKYTVKDNVLVDYANSDWADAPKLKIRANGQKDWSAIEDFLFERMTNVVTPRFTDVVVEHEESGNSDNVSDDLPF